MEKLQATALTMHRTNTPPEVVAKLLTAGFQDMGLTLPGNEQTITVTAKKMRVQAEKSGDSSFKALSGISVLGMFFNLNL